jgi:hypothetical protein
VWQTGSVLFGLTINGTSHSPSQLKQDVAFFLLARGDYAWLGYGRWGMTWPFNPEPAHGELPPLPHGIPRPELMDTDFGHPLGLCTEKKGDGSGAAVRTFTREWTKASVELSCGGENNTTFEATITMK